LCQQYSSTISRGKGSVFRQQNSVGGLSPPDAHSAYAQPSRARIDLANPGNGEISVPAFSESMRLFFFHHALQRMLVLAREIHHLRDLGLCDLVGEHAAFADAMMMNVQHDLGGGLQVLLKELLKDVNDELHRSVVVIQYEHAIEI